MTRALQESERKYRAVADNTYDLNSGLTHREMSLLLPICMSNLLSDEFITDPI
jgi:hypothetical protein